MIIDNDEVRSQRLAALLTLTGARALVATTTYQAFNRCLLEHFLPQAVLIGQHEEIGSTLFSRFSQYLKQESGSDVPIIRIGSVHLLDGNLLIADERLSTSVHQVSPLNRTLLKNIWQIVPAARIPLDYDQNALVLTELPKIGLKPHVTHLGRSNGLHFWEQMSAAKRIIPSAQWDAILTDVGLAQFRQEEKWLQKTEQHIVPIEYYSLLTRAVLLSNPMQPAKQEYDWAMLVDAEVLQKPALIFVVQQASRFLGQDRMIRMLLDEIVKQTNIVRGENLLDYKRLQDGSYIMVVYSNMFTYGFMGGTQPSCSVWIAALHKGLEISRLQKRWKVREIECSTVSHTGHCVFHLTPGAS